MNKLTVATIVSLFTISTSQAQFSVGLRAGVTGTTIADPAGYDAKNQAGGVAGAFVRFGDQFYVQSGFDYYGNQTGLQPNASGDMQDFDFTSFNVPLWIGYKFGEDDLNFRIFGGGSANFISEVESNNLELDEDDLRSVHGLWNIGIGGDIRRFTIDFAYERAVDVFFKKNDIGGQLSRFTATVGFKIFKRSIPSKYETSRLVCLLISISSTIH